MKKSKLQLLLILRQIKTTLDGGNGGSTPAQHGEWGRTKRGLSTVAERQYQDADERPVAFEERQYQDAVGTPVDVQTRRGALGKRAPEQRQYGAADGHAALVPVGNHQKNLQADGHGPRQLH